MAQNSFVEDTNTELPASEPSVADKRALVERIVATPPFCKSERLVSFLLHVCQMESAGLASKINEQKIGEAVFGRSKNYDPSIDGIVRSHASRLRVRLDQYFETDGVDEPIRLSIPRGGYVPSYEPRLIRPLLTSQAIASDLPIANRFQQPDPLAVPLKDSGAQPRDKRSRRWWMIGMLVFFASLAGFVWNSSIASRIKMLTGSRSPSDEFWSSVFIPGRETTLVVGDAGVNMFENMVRRQLSTEEYSSRSWLNDPYAQTPPGYSWAPIATRNYTPWFVVGFATRLARLPEVHDGQLKSISARDLTLNVLKNEQLILVGGPEYDPWEQLLWRERNFHIVYDGVENSISVINTQPEAGELSIYKWRQTDTTNHSGYSLISLSRNLNGNGRILELEGSTAQADEAAAEFVLDRVKIDPFLRKAINADGQLADFEMVLQTNFVAGGNTDSHVVAYRIRRQTTTG